MTELGLRYLSDASEPAKPIVWKETTCETFTPYFLESGATVVIIIRDPRDTLTSQHYGKADLQIGAPRPILFQIRQWRKSVA